MSLAGFVHRFALTAGTLTLPLLGPTFVIAEFSCGPLGDILRQYFLEKSQVARQLLNYKKRRYLNKQVSILLNQSDLDKARGQKRRQYRFQVVELTCGALGTDQNSAPHIIRRES